MTVHCKVWLLMHSGKRLEIETNDDVCQSARREGRAGDILRRHGLIPGHDGDALRRARLEASQGRAHAMRCVAIHQYEKRHTV